MFTKSHMGVTVLGLAVGFGIGYYWAGRKHANA